MGYGFLGRRALFRAAGVGGLGLITAGWMPPAQAASTTPLTPDAALEQLLEGNRRFRHRPRHPHQSMQRLSATAQSQHPFAAILSCADSRVSAEIVFDQGLGDLFDVRIAGNIVTPEALGSLEYAAVLLEAPLLMVLGHERCGAVTAAVKQETLAGKMGSFIEPIQWAVTQTKSQPGDPVENAVVANVQYQAKQLLDRSPLLAERVTAGQLKIVGARYDLDAGEVAIVT